MFWACPNCLEYFLIEVGFLIFIMGTIGDIAGVLCVIFLQFIGFLWGENIHSIGIWSINTHWGGKVLLSCSHFIGAPPPPTHSEPISGARWR